MGLRALLQRITKTKYLLSGICLLFAGIGLEILGFLIRDNEWGKYGWATVMGVLLLGASFLLFLGSLIRIMDYQSLRNTRSDKKENKDSETKPT